MPTFGAELGMQAASGAIGTGMGLLLERHQDKRQLKQQGKLQALEITGQKEMSDYNYAKQLQMWEDTNFSAQMEQLKKAGLNPGLLYGMGGAGGATTGQPSGNVTGGKAAEQSQIQQSLEMGMQLQLLKAQKENIEADTANKKADLPVKGAQVGKIGAETASITQGIENQKAQELLTTAQTKIARLEALFKSETMEDAIDIVNSQRAKWITDIDIALTQLGVDRATAIQKSELLKNQVQEVISKTALNKAQEAATKAGVEQHWTEISQRWEQLSQSLRGLDQKDRELNIRDFEAEMKAKYPGAWNVIGRILNEAANGIGAIWGQKADTDRKPSQQK